jgi:PKD repeat protein
VNPDSPIVIGLPTNSTLFGISMTPTIKSGANVVIRWQDGTPMAVTCTNGGGKIVFINDFWSWYGFSWRGDHSFGTNLIDKILTYIASRSAYAPYGNIISLPIAPVLFDKWDAVAFTKDISSAGTALTVDVLATNDVLLAANVTNGANLASLPAVVSQTAIKLRANLSTSDSTNTPKLSDWSVTFLTTADTALISIWSNISDSIQDANGTIDSDADGLPDFWEWQYFGSLNAPNGAPNADPDGDGQNNQTEFLAGTNPTNSISYWRIQASPTNGVAPLFVGFSENSMGLTITNRMWNFGDGTTSSAISPNHSYTNSGTFSVGLTIFNVHGTATLVASNLITVSPPPVPYPQAVTNAGPIAYWRLNETNGATVAVDFLGFHNGTISANVTPGVSGPQSPLFPGFETNNTAIRFNCVSGSYLTMPALNLNTNTVTITGWINPTGNQPGWAPIAFCRDGNTVAGLHFGSESIANELRYSWNNSRWDKSTGLVVPTGQWSFVALVVTPTNGTVYLGTNGILRAFTDVASEPNQAFGTSLLIGYDPSQGSRLFRGAIDEVAIYNHSLTPTQIQQLYTSGLTTPPPPLTAFQTWQFQHFGCTNCLQAAENADPDGDGQNNFAEFMAGTDPLSAASAFRILWLAPEGDNVRITWATAGGRTNAVQAAINDADGCYTTNFIDLSGSIIILGSGDATTNYLDVSGATNAPARFYRIRLVP